MKKELLLLKQARINFLPQDWEISTIEKCCYIANSLRKPISVETRNLIQGEYPYYGPTGILDYINEYKLDGKYALIGEDGDHFLKYKTWKQTQLVNGKFNVNNHVHVIQGTNKCLAEWFYVFFQHRNILSFTSRQGSGRYKLNKNSLLKLPILLPPLPEQKKIVDIISSCDRAIELTEKLIASKHKLKRGLMQKLLTGKLRFPEFEGQKYNLVEIKDLITTISIRNHQAKRQNYKQSGRYPIIDQGKDYIAGFVDNIPPINQNLPVIIFGDHTRIIKWVNTPFVIGADGVKVLVSKNEKSNLGYLYFLLDWACERMPNLGYSRHFSMLKQQIVPYFDNPLYQNKIAKILFYLEEDINQLLRKLELLKQEKKGLMQQLLTGKTRVPLNQ